MASNLRSKPIEGHVTDSAGNVLRNAQVVIKQSTPTKTVTVDTTQTDDDGYFKSRPLPNGQYDIYESGIWITREHHTPDSNAIQCFKPNPDNYDTTIIENFQDLADNNRLNYFRYFLQIEPEFVDTFQFGNTYPLYQTENVGGGFFIDEISAISSFYNAGPDFNITTTRFDIEYYSPITALSKTYKRIRWAGVPGLKFNADSKILVPIDYFSIVANMPKYTTRDVSSWLTINSVVGSEPFRVVTISSTNANYRNLVSNVKVGDILYLSPGVDWSEGGVNPPSKVGFYGIITNINATQDIVLEEWASTRFESDPAFTTASAVQDIYAYDGIFPGIFDIDEDVNERFTVVEDIYTQNRWAELYNYTKVVPQP
jgi:hypothetical protein